MPYMTQADLNAYNARRATQARKQGDDGGKAKQTPAGREHELHGAILDECKRRGWVVYHGSMAHRTRRTVGEPDFVVAASDGRTYHIEAKTRSGKLSMDQRAMMADLSRLGHTAAVVRSLEEFLLVVGGFRENK